MSVRAPDPASGQDRAAFAEKATHLGQPVDQHLEVGRFAVVLPRLRLLGHALRLGQPLGTHDGRLRLAVPANGLRLGLRRLERLEATRQF